MTIFEMISSSVTSTLLVNSFLAGQSEHSTFRGGSATLLVCWHGDRRRLSSIFTSDIDDILHDDILDNIAWNKDQFGL